MFAGGDGNDEEEDFGVVVDVAAAAAAVFGCQLLHFHHAFESDFLRDFDFAGCCDPDERWRASWSAPQSGSERLMRW